MLGGAKPKLFVVMLEFVLRELVDTFSVKVETAGSSESRSTFTKVKFPADVKF